MCTKSIEMLLREELEATRLIKLEICLLIFSLVRRKNPTGESATPMDRDRNETRLRPDRLPHTLQLRKAT